MSDPADPGFMLLDDTAIAELITPRLAASAMREAVIAAYTGEMHAPPRAGVRLGGRRLAFTCGDRPGDWFGYRSYIVPGTQAWHQLWALPERFRMVPIIVHSRDPNRRRRFAERARRELALDVREAVSAGEAVAGADVVLLATSSPTPVVGADELHAADYVATLGPKQVGRSEFDPLLATDAALVVSDSPEQVAAYDPPNVLVGGAAQDRLEHLGAVLSGGRRVPDGQRVFLSVGLAGTEVWLLEAALRSI